MIDHLWVLWLLAPLVLTLLWKDRRHHLRRSSARFMRVAVKQHRGRINFKKILPYFLFIPALTLLIAAAADYTIGYRKTFKKYVVHNYILLDDGSGSMVDWTDPKGIGSALKALIAGNRAFLEMLADIPRETGSRDLAGLIIFSSDPYIVAYPTDDYDSIAKKLELVYWNKEPLNQGTRLNSGLWSAIQMVVRRNGKIGGEQYLENDLDVIELALGGRKRNLKLPKHLEDKTAAIAGEITGVSFVVFTDGIFNLDGSQVEMSTAKALLLCKKLGIRVYLISTAKVQPETADFIKQTGGQVRFIRQPNDVKNLRDVYREIAALQRGEHTLEDRPQKKSLYLWFGVPGLGLLFLWLLVKNTLSRSLTSI